MIFHHKCDLFLQKIKCVTYRSGGMRGREVNMNTRRADKSDMEPRASLGPMTEASWGCNIKLISISDDKISEPHYQKMGL